MDNIAALNVFVIAAETRSFVRAGEILGVSSSAIGKTMARLEKRLGVRLFHRNTRSIAITAEGIMFLERCRRIFSEIEAAEQELSQTIAAPRGWLRVSLPLAGMLFMPTITKFMRAFPDVMIDLDFTDRLVDVIEEGFDAVVRTGEMTDSRLMVRTLGRFSHRVVGSKEYFDRFGIPKRPEDLSAHMCLHHKYPSTGRLERWPLRCDAGVGKLELPVSSMASTLEPLISMAEAGLGAQRRLKRLDLMAHRPWRDAKLVRRPGEALMPRRRLEGLERIERREAAKHRDCMRKSKAG